MYHIYEALGQFFSITYSTSCYINFVYSSHIINYDSLSGGAKTIFNIFIFFFRLKVSKVGDSCSFIFGSYNEPSGVKIEGGITENSYIPRHLGKSMSGRVQEETRSLFINFSFSFISYLRFGSQSYSIQISYLWFGSLSYSIKVC